MDECHHHSAVLKCTASTCVSIYVTNAQFYNKYDINHKANNNDQHSIEHFQLNLFTTAKVMNDYNSTV